MRYNFIYDRMHENVYGYFNSKVTLTTREKMGWFLLRIELNKLVDFL